MEAFGADVDLDTFWGLVKTNLQAGRVRLLFVADEIPHELRRIVEFLNEQMSPAEVLAVEIRQYAGDGQRTLVPRVLGQTAEAERKKTPSTRPRSEPWTEDTFLAKVAQLPNPVDADLSRKLIAWAKETGFRVDGGRGAVQASLNFRCGDNACPVGVYETGTHVRFSVFVAETKALLKDTAILERACDALNRIEGVQIAPDDKYPGFPLALLQPANAWSAFTEAAILLLNALDDDEDPHVQ